MRGEWKQLRRRAVQPIARRAGDAVLGGRGVLMNRFLTGKLIPLSPDTPYSLLSRMKPDDLHDGLPVPPRDLWQRWGLTLESYLRGGRADAAKMLADLAEVGADEDSLQCILDFGCAEGRMLRFLPRDGERSLWGVDVNAERIAWCQQNLSPPLRFATTTTAPHLPFADDSFDLAYGISVFTHISELADAWFLELLRVTRPGGHLYMTIHDEHTIELVLGNGDDGGAAAELADLVRHFDDATGALSRDWVYFAVHADPGAQVFFRTEELVRRWSLLAELSAVKQAAIGYQTALVFRRGEARPPRAARP